MTRTKWTLVTGFIICVLAAIAIEQASKAPDIAFDVLGSGTVPMFVAVSLIVLVALMMIEEFAFGGPDIEGSDTFATEQSKAEVSSPRWSTGTRTTASLVVFLCYLLALDFTHVPFWIATFFATYLCSRILEGGRGRGHITSLIIAAIVAVGIEVIFTNFLLIDLP